MPILLACQFVATSSATIFLVRLVTNLALCLPLVTKRSKKTPLPIKQICLINGHTTCMPIFSHFVGTSLTTDWSDQWGQISALRRPIPTNQSKKTPLPIKVGQFVYGHTTCTQSLSHFVGHFVGHNELVGLYIYIYIYTYVYISK